MTDENTTTEATTETTDTAMEPTGETTTNEETPTQDGEETTEAPPPSTLGYTLEQVQEHDRIAIGRTGDDESGYLWVPGRGMFFINVWRGLLEPVPDDGQQVEAWYHATDCGCILCMLRRAKEAE